MTITGISIAFVINSYKTETGDTDYMIIKYTSKEKKKRLYSFLNPTQPKDKVFNLKMKNFEKGVFLKIQANLNLERNFMKIFNYNWCNRTFSEIFRIYNVSKYLPGENYLKLRSFTGSVYF